MRMGFLELLLGIKFQGSLLGAIFISFLRK